MMKSKKILIVEDEDLNGQRLQRLLSEIRPNYVVTAILPSIKKTVEWLSIEDSPDLIFMDIKLSDGESFEIFSLIDVEAPVIFTTAYDEYALKAFKHNSIDYLLKPIEAEELELSILKFEKLNKESQEQSNLIKNILEFVEKRDYRTRFLLPYKDGFRKLGVEDIAYIFYDSGVTYAITFDGQRNVLPDSLETLEKQLNPKHFFRANRQYLIHINAIIKIHNYVNSKLKLEIKQLNEAIEVSRLKANLLKSWLNY